MGIKVGPKESSMDHRLTKSDRLLKRSEFLAVSRRADIRINTRNFIVLLRANERIHSRLGITVSKKVGQAVTRNRVKRYVREFFRTNKSFLPKGYDLVVLAKRGASELDQAQVRSELARLAKRS